MRDRLALESTEVAWIMCNRARQIKGSESL